MGVLNVTPDSFSDGGRYLSADAAKARIDELLQEGADIIDIGGESTRPGSSPVPPAEQIERIRHPLVHAARERRAVVSVDTTSPAVARYALSEGASVINDVSCFADVELGRAVAEAGAALVLMHARGSMGQMRGYSDAPGDAYGDVVADVAREWRAAQGRAIASGVAPHEIVFDPGVGYMKSAAHSLELLRRLAEFAALGAPVLVGPSRKSFIVKATGDGAPPSERLGGTIAACLAAAEGGADILRVHDVAEVKQALALRRALGDAHA
jgi:dihydropteroate synthase